MLTLLNCVWNHSKAIQKSDLSLSKQSVLLQDSIKMFRSRCCRVDHHRSEQSVKDHILIIEALEQRDADKAEKLIREHALSLAEHIELYAQYLD